MHTPVLTASLLAVCALSPVLGVPVHGSQSVRPHGSGSSGGGGGGGVGSGSLVPRGLTGLGIVDLATRNVEPHAGRKAYHVEEWKIEPRKFWKKSIETINHYIKRMDDSETMGGNAHTGSTGSVNGGSVHNSDPTLNEGMPTMLNLNSNNAGLGGTSQSGCAGSGKNSDKGVGGNASSGNTGNAVGGNVDGAPSGMVNMNSNNGGGAGMSESGCAAGGDSNDEAIDTPNQDFGVE